MGVAVCHAAVALGAAVIEKHLTLDRALPGPDHFASLEPDEFTTMVKGVREIEMALGDGVKGVMPSERDNMVPARKSLVTARAIRKGERFGLDNLTVKRPGNGVPALSYWSWIGQTADRDYAADEMIAL
jgi:N-acetylneuraminate synthase